MSQAREVKVGGRTRTIDPFRSYKALLAADIVAEVITEVHQVLEQVRAWRAEYREKNVSRITRQQCRERVSGLRQLAAQAKTAATEEENAEKRSALEERAGDYENRATLWESQIADMGDRDYIEAPKDPTTDEVAVFAVPIVLKELRDQVIELVALTLTSDDDLKEAWLDGNVRELLPRQGRELLLDLELGEEISLASTVWEVAKEQLNPHMQELSKLRNLAGGETKETETETDPSPETPTSEQPTSSTPSEATDGPAPSASSSDTPTASTPASPSA